MLEKGLLIENGEETYGNILRIERIDPYNDPNYVPYYKQALSFDTDRMWHTSDNEFDYDLGALINTTYGIFYNNQFIGLIITSAEGAYNSGSYIYGLSIVIDKKYRGQHIGTYALKYVKNVLFNRPLCEYVVADILAENDSSIALFTKNGFYQTKDDGEVKTYICKNSNYKK